MIEHVTRIEDKVLDIDRNGSHRLNEMMRQVVRENLDEG